MLLKSSGFVLFLVLSLYLSCFKTTAAAYSKKPKSVLAVILARNKEHTLPYFLTLFSQLNYPKERISLFIRSDHNIDRTTEVIKEWLNVNKKNYHSIDVKLSDGPPNKYPDEESPTNWTDTRFEHIINLKEEAFHKARKIWADYILFIDSDVLITERNMLSNLIEEKKPIIAPMLNSLGTYSNYWCGMTENYWYERTDDYLPILDRKVKGCFPVPMIHSCVLVDLTLSISEKLSYNSRKFPNYKGPKDDIITFAVGAKELDVELYICNDIKYGFIPSPLNEEDRLSKDFQLLSDLKLEILIDNPPLKVSKELVKFVSPLPPKTKLGFDNIYLINLQRRPDRKERMLWTLDELGIEVEVLDAVDGKQLNASYLERIGVKQLVNYKDPWSKRDMTYGEIGCFLSHYNIWRDMVEKNYRKVVVFEDDIRFEPFFKDKLSYMMKQMKELNLQWDLVYLGRKKLKDSDEPWVKGSNIVVHVDYSYWTLCYIITLDGAKKLLASEPLSKLVPVDEYIPIMFDKHPEADWKAFFEGRTLNAFSAAPLMVFPTHYTGEDGYISDTEESSLIDENLMPEREKNLPMGPPTFQVKSLVVDIGVGDLKDEL
ncbi:UNVERIFIED_CONTAM: hypothetical protein RMT77_003348 [Armadillidium vulgare]